MNANINLNINAFDMNFEFKCKYLNNNLLFNINVQFIYISICFHF